MRKYTSVIATIVVAMALLVAFRFWREAALEAPVDAVYVEYLALLEQQSPHARAYRARYERAFGRDTVASRDFEHVCAAMTGLARQDQALDIPAEYEALKQACLRRSDSRHYPPERLPQR